MTSWKDIGTSFSILWLFQYPAGAKAPPDESSVKNKSFLHSMDVGVARIHHEHGGLGIPNSFLYWHWAMVPIFMILFTAIFYSTTIIMDDSPFPWMTLLHKLVICFHVWESLGLGVLHGPLHQKMSPPFQDWWYRLTPGTIKYKAPFLPNFLASMQRNYLDVLVEGILTYGCAVYALMGSSVTPQRILPLTLCALYEFIFDYGQHIHNYGTQNLHFFICMCFEQGQVSAIQLFLIFFYFCSGFCKQGPTFQYMFTSNLLTAKFMVDVPWAVWFRKTFFVDYRNEDYRLTKPAWWLATTAATIEMLVPFAFFTNDTTAVYLALATIAAMHTFIISTLIIDVFVWNFVDTAWCIILYGIVSTGVDWEDFHQMPHVLTGWFLLHGVYVLCGHVFPNTMPYVVAHRHAAGNWAQGIFVVKKNAIAKLAKLKSHAGMPSLGPGWAGEWFGFHAFFAYVWNWNLPSRFLVPLVMDVMGTGAPKHGMFTESGDSILIHSVLFSDALLAHLRFDGLSNLELVKELGRVCEFEEGECVLAWAGAFPTFFLPSPKATWAIVDSKKGVTKEGTYVASDVMDPAWKKPSDLYKTNLCEIVGGKKVD